MTGTKISGVARRLTGPIMATVSAATPMPGQHDSETPRPRTTAHCLDGDDRTGEAVDRQSKADGTGSAGESLRHGINVGRQRRPDSS